MKRWLEIVLVVGLLAVGFVVRLYKINNPVADWHSWRQADTASVTRNFVKNGVDILSPRYDDLSDVSAQGFNPNGYRLVEFPIYNLIHYAAFTVAPFGALEFWGRMVSIVASLVSAFCLYILVKKFAGQLAGFATMATFLFLPFNIYFSRVILPDPLMVAVALVSLTVFFYHRRWLAYILGLIAVAIKPTAIFLLLPVLVSWRFAPVIIMMPFFIWRMWQTQHPEGVPGSIWLLNGDHIRFKGAFFRWIFGDRLGRLILGYWGLWPALEGIMNLPRELLWLIGGAVAYVFIFATGNVRHDYYQIPIIPAIAVAVGVGIAVLWHRGSWFRRAVVIVAVVFMLAFGWYEVRGNYQINNPGIVYAGQAADKLLPSDAVVIADYNGDTAFLYQTNRKGFPNVPLPIEEMVDRFNVGYYVSVNYDARTNELISKYAVVDQTPQYVIIDLTQPK